MELRKIAISGNFSSKRKVVSRFGIGVGASLLIFTVFCINNPFNFSFLNATSGGFSPFPLFFRRQSAGISKSPPESLGFSKRDEEQEKSLEKTRVVNLPGYDKNSSFSSISVGDKGVEETCKTNVSENFENRSSFSGEERVAGKTNDENSSEMAKNVNFLNFGGQEMASKNTHEGNSSENLENRSSYGGEFVVTGENLEGNPRKNAKNASVLNFEGGETVREKTHKGNFSESIDGGNSFNREEMEIGRVKEGNLSRNDENVREEIGEKTREGNFSKNFGKGNSFGKQKVIIKQNSDAKNSEFSNGGGRIFDKTHGENVSKNDKNSGSVDITQEGNLSEKETKKIARSYDASASAKIIEGASRKCDIFNGRWVRNERKPYYPAGSCPFIDKDFNCHGNGRPDEDFVKWRWQPNGCNIPSLNASDLLERLRGKRLLFVGDSLNRNMWESLVCILHHSVVNKKKVHEVSGRKEFRMKGYYSFRYEDYNCSIDYVRSTYLVRESSVTRRKRWQDETLRLDLMDDTISVYREASVLVFNTGHWWTHEKTSKGKDYYQEGNYVYPMLKVLDAYAKALTTWARWIDKNIDARRTRVFFRGYSPTHFSGRWNSGGQCHNETEPIFNESYLGNYPSKMRALEHVLEGMKTPVVYLNISRLSDYRKDGHPSIYRKGSKNDLQSQDCSHWCLPGVPDTWNELLYASLVMDD